MMLSVRKENEQPNIRKVLGFAFEEIMVTNENGVSVLITPKSIELGYKDDDRVNKWVCVKKIPFDVVKGYFCPKCGLRLVCGISCPEHGLFKL